MDKAVNCKVKIHNVPEYATEGFIVARTDGSSRLWFFGCYNDEESAREVSQNVNGVYFEIAK